MICIPLFKPFYLPSKYHFIPLSLKVLCTNKIFDFIIVSKHVIFSINLEGIAIGI